MVISGTGAGATNNVDRQPGARQRNLISGNTDFAVEVTGSQATSNVIEGNLIGTDATGAAALGNSNSGLGSLAAAVIVESVLRELHWRKCAGASNFISGNSAGYGVLFDGANNNLLEGNYIGVTSTTESALGNEFGVGLVSASGNTVGAPGAGNIIDASTGAGVSIDSASSGNTVAANFIGLNAV